MPVWPAATAWQQGHTCIPAAVASAHQQPQSRGSSRWLEPPACGTRHAKRPISVCNAQPSGPDFEVIPPRRRPQPSSTLGEDGVEEYDLEDLENQYFETAEEAEQALQRKREEAAQRRAETTDEESEEFSRNSEEYEEEDPQARQRYEEYGDDPEGLSLGYGPNALGLPRDHMLLDRAPLPEPAPIQQTVARSFHCAGLGVQNGATNEIRVLPAHAGQGRYFVYVQTPEPLGLQFLGATAAEVGGRRNDFEEQAAIRASDFPITDSEPLFNPRPAIAPMRRGEFLAYLEAQAAGYTGTFDEWEYDQYPRLQPPGFGAADHDEEIMIRTPRRGEASVPAELQYAHAAPEGYTYLVKDDFRVNCVEGLLAALEACGVNNCRIEVRGDEVPFMDGSARPFVRLIHMAGVCIAPARPGSEDVPVQLPESDPEDVSAEQLAQAVEAAQAQPSPDPEAAAADAEMPTEWLALQCEQELTVREGEAFVSFVPQADQLLTAGLDYALEAPIIGRQWHTWSSIHDPHFYFEISPARAFHTSQRALQLRKAGHLRGAGVGTHMVAMGKRWYDPAQARFYQGHNEQARNRVMTLMGNLALLNDRGNGGVPYGHIVSYQADAELELRFLRQLKEHLLWVQISQAGDEE